MEGEEGGGDLAEVVVPAGRARCSGMTTNFELPTSTCCSIIRRRPSSPEAMTSSGATRADGPADRPARRRGSRRPRRGSAPRSAQGRSPGLRGGGDLVDHRGSAAQVVGRAERRGHPSPSRPQRLSSRGRCRPTRSRAGPARATGGPPPSYRWKAPSWSTVSPAQKRRSSGTTSSNRLARSSRFTWNAWCSAGSGAPRPNAGRRRPFDEAVERGQLLGEEHRVAPGHHQHREAELEAGRAPRRHGQPDDRVRAVAGDPLGQPQRSRTGVAPARRRGRAKPCASLDARTPSPYPIRTFIPAACHAAASRSA